jgi:hypothetical protein
MYQLAELYYGFIPYFFVAITPTNLLILMVVLFKTLLLPGQQSFTKLVLQER